MSRAAELRVIDFDGISMTGTEFNGCFLADFDITAQFPLEAVMAYAPEDFPHYIRGDPQDKVIPLHVVINNATQALIDELKTAFSPFRDPVYLHVQDDDGNDRRMLVKSLGLTPWETHSNTYVASLQATEPIWESLNSNAATLSISGTDVAAGYNFDLDNIGNEMAVVEQLKVEGFNDKGHDNHYCSRWPINIAWRSPLEGLDSLGLPYPINITNGEWDSAAEYAAGRLTLSGTDVAVYVDGVEVDRYIENPLTTGTSIWCPIAFQPAKVATLAATMTAGAPTALGSIVVNNPGGTAGFPDSGVIMIDDEAIYYGQKSAYSFDQIWRGYWRTTAAGHSLGSTIYWIEHEITMVTDYTNADPLSRADREPVLDLPYSSNVKHVYHGDYFVPNSLRPGQFQRELRNTDQPGGAVTTLTLTGTDVVVTDELPGADRPNYDSLSLYVPCYVDASAGVYHGYRVDHEMVYQLYGIDEEGFEVYLLRRDIRAENFLVGYYSGAAAWYPNLTFVPGQRLSRISFHARNHRITGGTMPEGGSWLSPGQVNDEMGQGLTLQNAGQVRSMCYRGRSSVPGDRAQIAYFRVFRSGVPETEALRATLVGVHPPVATDISVFYSDGDDMATRLGYLPADQYAAVWRESGGTVGTSQVNEEPDPVYSGGAQWDETGGVWAEVPGRDFLASACGENATQQGDAQLGSGRTVAWQNIEVNLDAAYVPNTVIGTRAANYFIEGVLENVTTGQVLTLFYPQWRNAGTTWFLYPQTHESWPRNGIEPPLHSLGAMEPSDLARWLQLDPGINNMRYTEPSIGNGYMRLVINWRHRWS